MRLSVLSLDSRATPVRFATVARVRSVSVGKVTPGGALAAVLFGSILRAILEFALPKDESLLIPHGEFNFDYGPGQVTFYSKFPMIL